tara:strand:- start:1215 stop:1538 length:324 start_codon:yes stop_codon:yes gene_type:complete
MFSCENSSKDMILGRWVNTESYGKSIFIFHHDNTYYFNFIPNKNDNNDFDEGTWIISDDILKITVTNKNKKVPKSYYYKINSLSQDSLQVSSLYDGEISSYELYIRD